MLSQVHDVKPPRVVLIAKHHKPDVEAAAYMALFEGIALP